MYINFRQNATRTTLLQGLSEGGNTVLNGSYGNRPYSPGSGRGSLVGSCEHCNELFCSGEQQCSLA
jgi:hypothetical protein